MHRLQECILQWLILGPEGCAVRRGAQDIQGSRPRVRQDFFQWSLLGRGLFGGARSSLQ